ncbi:hypothetical protein LguiA_022222 [Lonicera macranthoides]
MMLAVATESLFSSMKVLLNDISGEARDGEIMAMLGASGSGKSTLIDALANRIMKGSLKGTVTLNGQLSHTLINPRSRGRGLSRSSIGTATRFSYKDLKVATENFSKKLGEGGFGSVFEGTLKDATKVAVKCLDGLTQVKKSLLAEVETIGSIHRVNLVRLIGFCVEKSHGWILVYEYMCNGSLDRWIYHQNDEGAILDWKCRKKVVLDIAKGLTYLHEDCRQKIIRLDIKPQNILLDENYNAKVVDFGLSKLVDRNQSQVMTTMRGTPGYLAPEWLNSIITEKVDLYSFGVVVLEICCGVGNLLWKKEFR